MGPGHEGAHSLAAGARKGGYQCRVREFSLELAIGSI